MTNDALQFLTYFPSMIWQLMTGFKIPGLNMTPAVFFFGILSFSLAFRFLMGVINISTSGFTNYQARETRAEKARAAREARRHNG